MGGELTSRQRRSGESAEMADGMPCAVAGLWRDWQKGGGGGGDKSQTAPAPTSLCRLPPPRHSFSHEMRQRKPPAKGIRPAGPSSSTKGKHSSAPALPVFTRLRILLLSLPLLLGWYIIFQRRSTARPLPTSFAVCSHSSGPPQIYTVDANFSLAECVVVDQGKIKDVGSLGKVRKVWGDVDMRGSSSGIKIVFLKAGQMLTPGL